DARKHQVRHGFAEDVARAHDHAIGRGAARREMPWADFAQPQWVVQRQRMRDAGLVEFWRHNPDVVGQGTGDFLDDLQAGRVDAVVIGAENSHPPERLFRSDSVTVTAPSYPAIGAEANPHKTVKNPQSSVLRAPDCLTVSLPPSLRIIAQRKRLCIWERHLPRGGGNHDAEIDCCVARGGSFGPGAADRRAGPWRRWRWRWRWSRRRRRWWWSRRLRRWRLSRRLRRRRLSRWWISPWISPRVSPACIRGIRLWTLL